MGKVVDGIISATSVGESTGWNDLIQPFSSARGRGTTEPRWRDIGNGQYLFEFTVGEELFVQFHVPHSYCYGTNAYPHIHFMVDQAMTVGQQVTWRFAYTIAKGHQQGQSLTGAETIIDLTYTADGTEVAGEHLIVECSDIQAFDLIEPDTLILARVELLSENVTGLIFGIMSDLHYQSKNDNTPNKFPPFV